MIVAVPRVLGSICASLAIVGLSLHWMHKSRAISPSPARTEIRIAHYMLAPATKAALEAIISDYERRRPEVKVIAMPIPERVYLTFVNAHINATTVPDLLQIGHQFNGYEELRRRYFCPITNLTGLPNPYNRGTPSEGKPWRDTFLDGMNGLAGYSAAEFQYYGIPMAFSTLRLFYNRTLVREITGRDEPPTDFPGFMAFCREVEAYAKERGRSMTPIAGSRMSGLFLMSQFFSAVNQRLSFDLDRNHSLELDYWDIPKGYLDGKWDFHTPSIRAGFELMHETGRHMQQGFLELPISEAVFQFLQQHAVTTIANSADSVILRDNASFPVGISRLPTVGPDDPRFGAMVLGGTSEADNPSGMTFGVIQRSVNRDVALDFLQYLGSHPASEIFSHYTGWTPMVASVPIMERAKSLQPSMEGYSGRFYAEMNGNGDGRFVAIRNLHLLFAHSNGVQTYCEDLTELYGPAMIVGLHKEIVNGFRNLRGQELGIVARSMAGEVDSRDLNRDVAGQNYAETRILQDRHRLQVLPFEKKSPADKSISK